MKISGPLRISQGYPQPFGATGLDGGINFALASAEAESVTLCLFKKNSTQSHVDIPLDAKINKTGNVWHILVHGLDEATLYAYQISSAFSVAHTSAKTFLMDPYARATGTGHRWGTNDSPYLPLGELPITHTFDWENTAPPNLAANDLVIYEMHVRAFTRHSSGRTGNPGSFLGVIEKIPHLLELGVNAVELLPVQEFNECEYFLAHPHAKAPLCNFWGYSTVNFFAPMSRYATGSSPGTAIREFKTMVKELHRNGIEVILDIVFNHTAEGNALGPILSYKGIDNAVYYLFNNHGQYSNYSGCGNTLNSNHPQVIEMIISCLRYWVVEMHVDGFRFDLASALTRNAKGAPLAHAPLIQSITSDPVLASIKLIAEPWDAAGLYQVGNFAASSMRWSEWNGKYRDAVRRFIRGTPGSRGEFATRLCGSEDLYKLRSPLSSLNFITAHDGFTLADLVSYNEKHNLENKEQNRDGANDNESWNCGKEGPTNDPEIICLRERQMRNFHLALMLSQGIPMLLMGDEYGHTKNGNNNTWCHDTELNWFLWNKLAEKADFYRFYRMLIAFRKRHPLLRRKSFLTSSDIDWHGADSLNLDWNDNNLFLAFTLKDSVQHNHLYAAFNPHHEAKDILLPPPPPKKQWRLIVDTAATAPHDITEENTAAIVSDFNLTLASYAAILMKAL